MVEEPAPAAPEPEPVPEPVAVAPPAAVEEPAPAVPEPVATAPVPEPTPAPSADATATVSAKDVKVLRDQSGAGMMDCKKALAECNGDIKAAAELLRKKGIAKAAKKAGRTAADGLIATYIHPGTCATAFALTIHVRICGQRCLRSTNAA